MSGSSGTEIERKFLVRRVPATPVPRRLRRIVQGYLVVGDDGEVRLRDIDGGAMLTVKKGRGLVRQEIEVALERIQFERLWPATDGRRMAKTRHEIVLGAVVAEVDVYEGACAGLITAEVEFESIAEAAAFEPPAWFDREVTDDERYRNRELAANGPPRVGP